MQACKTCNVGARIMIGGVHGDVVDLSFMQTQIMEMGESPKEQADAPSMWVRSRQFTGRIVTVTNEKVHDRAKAEAILLEAARRHAVTGDRIGEEEVQRLETNFGIKVGDVDPQTYWRITENWLEITVRFLAPDHGIRRIKDQMSRDIMAELDKAKIGIASGTYAIV